MKSFNEWLKERNSIEENIADYTPSFIRKPLQNMGLMGHTTAGKRKAERERRERMASLEAGDRRRLAAGKHIADVPGALQHQKQLQQQRQNMTSVAPWKRKLDAMLNPSDPNHVETEYDRQQALYAQLRRNRKPLPASHLPSYSGPG